MTRATFERFELGRLVKAWSDSGSALPVAVVVSIFDDLCESLGGPVFTEASRSEWSHPLALDHVVIDQQGFARLTVTPSEPVSAVSRLLYDTLSAGQGDLGVPAAARPVIEQGTAHDPWQRPQAPETLQRLLRTSLGPPAGRDEVMAACAVLPKVDEVPPIEIPSLVGPSMTTEPRSVVSPMDLGILVAPEPDTIVEDMIIPLEDPVSLRPAKVEVASPAPALDLGPPPLLPKPTVRIEPEKRKPVSLPTAPAARLGSTASLPDSERTGTIQLPSEGRGTMWLLAFLFLCVGGLIAWLLGLFPGL